MNIIDLLQWRYAAKKFRNEKVSDDKVEDILNAIRLSASSAGIQPYRVVLIQSDEMKQKLQASSFNQQVTECSHLLVFAAMEKIHESHIDAYIQLMADTRGVAVESLAGFKTSLQNNLLKKTAEESFHWASKQAYIGLGTGLIAAASLSVDACPMEGLNGEEFDEILGLNKLGLKSVVMMALGYRDEERDFLSKMKKVRLPMEEFVVRG